MFEEHTSAHNTMGLHIYVVEKCLLRTITLISMSYEPKASAEQNLIEHH